MALQNSWFQESVEFHGLLHQICGMISIPMLFKLKIDYSQLSINSHTKQYHSIFSIAIKIQYWWNLLAKQKHLLAPDYQTQFLWTLYHPSSSSTMFYCPVVAPRLIIPGSLPFWSIHLHCNGYRAKSKWSISLQCKQEIHSIHSGNQKWVNLQPVTLLGRKSEGKNHVYNNVWYSQFHPLTASVLFSSSRLCSDLL